MNTLFYGDNLNILREHIADESVDLIYLDPPFNSNRSYNVLFKEASGKSADAQITAFDDTWHWGPASEETLREIETTAPPHVVEMMQAIVGFVGRNDVTACLVMMAVRLIELHRVLGIPAEVLLQEPGRAPGRGYARGEGTMRTARMVGEGKPEGDSD